MLWNCQMCSTELRDFYEYSGVLKGIPRKRFWRALGHPKCSFSQTVAAVLLFSRRLEFREFSKRFCFSGFLKIQKCCVSIQLQRFCCFSEFEGSWSARIFEILGVPEGSFLNQL